MPFTDRTEAEFDRTSRTLVLGLLQWKWKWKWDGWMEIRAGNPNPLSCLTGSLAFDYAQSLLVDRCEVAENGFCEYR